MKSQELSHVYTWDLIFSNFRKGVDTYCRITVKDEEMGMSEKKIHRTFEPFYSTKSAEKSLGLTIIPDIVNKYFGGIDIKSQVGKGTEFTIYLPTHRI